MKLSEKCPDCETNLELAKACCDDRKKGHLLVKKCFECGYSVKWEPKELFKKTTRVEARARVR